MSDDFANFILTILVICILLAGGAYLVVLFFPYFVYYVIPFLVFSGVICFLLKVFTYRPEEEKNDEKGYLRGRYRYRSLVILYPVLVFITLAVFHMGSERAILVNKKGEEQGVYLDWPRLNKSFNELRFNAYEDSFFKSLRKASRNNKRFDRKEMSWIVWFALFFGGPGLYLVLNRNEDEDLKEIKKEVKERVKWKEEGIRSREENLEKTIQKEIAKYKKAYSLVSAENDKIKQENKVLRAKLEFSSDLPSVKSNDGDGVLDKDVF